MHALDSWCERYRSGTGARQSDRSGLWIKTRSDYISHAPLRAPTVFHTLRSALRRYFTAVKPAAVQKNTVKPAAIEIKVHRVLQ